MNSYNIFLYFLFFYHVKCFEMPETWVNPSDFHHSRRTEYSLENSPTESTFVPSQIETENLSCICPVISTNAYKSFFTRVLNKILTRANLKNFRLPKDGIRIVPLTLYFNENNLEILQQFADENQDTYSWSDFDDAFNSILTIPRTSSEGGTNSNEDVIEERDYALFFFISIVGALLIIGLWLFLKSGSLFKSFGGIYLVTFSITLVWNLIRAYKVEKAKISLDTQLLKKMTNRSGWKNYVPGAFLRIFDIDDERLLPSEYDPMINVDFGAIFVETFFTFLNVLPMLGAKFGQMTHNFYAEQNFFIRYVGSFFNVLLNPIIFGIGILLFIIIQKGFFLKAPLFTFSLGQKSPQAHPLPAQNDNFILHNTGRGEVAAIKGTNNYKAERNSGAKHSITNHEEEPSTSKPKLRNPRVLSRKGPWQGSVIRYGFIKKQNTSN